MKNTFLFLGTILFLACNPSDRSISQTTPNQSFSLKTAANHLTRYEDNSVSLFLQLIEEGVEIPHKLIEEQTLITHPYGSFFGETTQSVNDNIQSIILKHIVKDCIRHFVLTTDGRKIIDQQLVAETCRLKPGESVYTYSDYAYIKSNFIGQLTYRVSQNPEINESLIKKTGFRIFSDGRIEKVSPDEIAL